VQFYYFYIFKTNPIMLMTVFYGTLPPKGPAPMKKGMVYGGIHQTYSRLQDIEEQDLRKILSAHRRMVDTEVVGQILVHYNNGVRWIRHMCEPCLLVNGMEEIEKQTVFFYSFDE
jgi:hypothetical protein